MRRRLIGNWATLALCLGFAVSVGCAKEERSKQAWLSADGGPDGGKKMRPVNTGMADDDTPTKPVKPGPKMSKDSGTPEADDDMPEPGDDDVPPEPEPNMTDDDLGDDDVPPEPEPEPVVPPEEDSGVTPEPDVDAGSPSIDVDAGGESCMPVTANETVCGDSIDDDCDRFVDCDDPDCRSDRACCVASAESEALCDNAADEDCDGLIDCEDPDCAADVSCQPVCQPVSQMEGSCQDAIDDDCDTLVDCEDPDCVTATECLPACVPIAASEMTCNDALDDDCNGFIDCEDPNCADDAACAPACVPATENCIDVADNDCDGFVDCADADCATGAACCLPDPDPTELCDDGKDNNCDGVVDCPVILSTVPELPPPGREAWEGGAVSASAARITLKAPWRPNYVVQCRSAKPALVNNKSFVVCNPQDPKNLTIQPFPDAEGSNPANDGLMTTQVRFAYSNGQSSQFTSFDYYVHSSMAGVQPCPRKAPDTDFLNYARPFLTKANGPVFTDADAKLAAPFVNIAFQPKLSSLFTVTAGQGNVEYLSLRRRFTLNSQKDLILMRRTYASRRATSRPCLTAMIRKHDSDLGPQGTENNNRYFRTGCDAVVMNKEGAGVCLVVGTMGNISIANPQNVDWGYWNFSYYGWVNWAQADNFVWRKLKQPDKFSPKCYSPDASCKGSNPDILFLPDRGQFAW